MPTPIQDSVRAAMTGGGDLDLNFDEVLNTRAPGLLQVYLHETDGGVRVDLNSPGEAATILWLPWKQGELQMLQPYSVAKQAPGGLFFTYYLTGCKVFAIRGGPVWHIDAVVAVAEFWPLIAEDDWVQENWQARTPQDVAYLHRAGQAANLWDLSAFLAGGPPSTYGAGNVGEAIVGGIVNDDRELDLYFKASPWLSLPYTATKLLKK